MFKNFPEQWQDLLKEKGITTETAIQKELFAPITEGDNVLGISPTGTGKTLAYLLPLLLSLKPKKAQQLLILAPNSELAGQIFDVTKQWAEPLGWSALRRRKPEPIYSYGSGFGGYSNSLLLAFSCSCESVGLRKSSTFAFMVSITLASFLSLARSS